MIKYSITCIFRRELHLPKPTRSQRKNTVYGAVSGSIIFIGLWAMFHFQINNIYYFIGVIIIGVSMGVVASSFVPDMRRKENKDKNMYTGLLNKTGPKRKASSKSKSQSTKLKTNSNLLRSEKEIMTLPLEELTWREFEELIFLYYKAKGYKPRRTAEGADEGVDLVIFNRHHNCDIAVQIKHYISGQPISVERIRELDSAKKNHRCILAEMITSSRFTKPALVEADRRRIVCRDREWVHSKLLPWRENHAKRKGIA